jgi:uncharacterized membrane protein (DUF485 family)
VLRKDANMDNTPEPHQLTPVQTQKAKETIKGLDEEISKKPKVRGNWLQNTLRAKYFKVSMTVFMMVLIFGTALLIAFRTGGPEKPVSAENIGIVPHATIIFPEVEEIEISTESSEIEPEPLPSP